MKGYYKLRKNALDLLRTQLPKGLYYHSLEHTQEVLRTCNTYIKRDNIPEHEAKLLRLGALTHDIGFTISNENHELLGKGISTEWMKALNFAESDIRIVQGLIMATQIPQSPKNDLEKILCDADLDYLGRSDFYKISNRLYNELKHYSLVKTDLEWNKIQIKFMQSHEYHTDFACKNRRPKKEERISELKKLVGQ